MNNANEDGAVPAVSRGIPIGGVNVKFPYKPYPAQTVIMSKMISGMKNCQNCLLESPTGSGKTLALLCAALAWQGAEYDKKRKFDAENLALVQEDTAINDGTVECDSCECGVKTADGIVKHEVLSEDEDEVMTDDDDSDFKPPIKKSLTQLSKTKMEIQEDRCECSCHHPAPKCVTHHQEYYVPRIYYGTRTHKQIAQLASELKKTAYRNARMDILASREHTCIHEHVSKLPNKNEECKKLLDQGMPPACHYKTKVTKLDDYDKLYAVGVNQAWDLETFVDVCRTKSACPYFVTRELLSKADIVFCPYSYLIDPFIRNTMNIALKRDIVILDEAHNIEDVCREGASMQLSYRNLEDIDKQMMGWETPLMVRTFDRLKEYIMDEGTKIAETDVSGQTTSPILGGAALVATLESRLGLNHATCAQLSSDMANLEKSSKQQTDEYSDNGKKSRSSDSSSISVKLMSVLEHLLGICAFILRDGNKHAEDFRMLVSKQQVTVEDTSFKPGEFRGRGRSGKFRHEINFTLNFWCMNPAIVFQSVVENARCIVLASGTLSPMSTFQSELGTTFPIQYEAPHVIGKSQMFAGCIGVSPSDKSLQAVYKNTETFDFQDGIGELTKEVCQVTPGGVLLFFTSYRLIDKMIDRWRSTKLYDKISAMKRIFVETSGSSGFEETLAEFYACCGKPAPEGANHPDDILSDDTDAGSPIQEKTSINAFFGNRTMFSQQNKRLKLDNKAFTKKSGVTPMSQRSKLAVTSSACHRSENANTNGALFLAVYRGKVSEGLNFADDYARAVIAVGIPYPALMDPQVKEKRSYNETHCRQRQILSGAEWYECQAFRALNQALGRCIRHRNDWGAIILVDERFCQQKMRSNEKISKWVRARRVIHYNFPMFRKNLVNFIQSEKLPSDDLSKSQSNPIVSSNSTFFGNISQMQPLKPSQQVSIAKSLPAVSAPSPTPIVSNTAKLYKMFSPYVPKNVPKSGNPIVIDDSPVKCCAKPVCPAVSPDLFDSGNSEITERTNSSLAANKTSPPIATVAPSCKTVLMNRRLVQHKFWCCRCSNDIFVGSCFLLWTASCQLPMFLTNHFTISKRQLPNEFQVAEVGVFGVRGDDQLVSSLTRVEGQTNLCGNPESMNSIFEADDMVTYEAYICRCSCGKPKAEIACWSIVGIHPEQTPKQVAHLLNKVIFNPYTVSQNAVILPMQS